MQIGLITSAMDYSVAGVSVYVQNMIKELLEIDNCNEYTLIHHEKSQNILYSHINELIIPYPKIPLKKTIGENLYLSYKLRSENFDIVHELAQRGSFFFKNKGKTILTIHDLSPILYPHTHDFFNVMVHRIFLPRAIKNAEQIIAVSQSTKNDIINLFNIPNKKITVVYNGIGDNFVISSKENLNNVKIRYNLPEKYILFVGTLEPRKNLILLIKALAYLKKKKFDIKCVLVGKKGWKSQGIFDAINLFNLEKDVTLLNYIPASDLPAIYQLSTVFVYPSLYEGFGLPVLEAMACGVPTIISNTSSLPEIAGSAGLQINPFNCKKLVDLITYLIKNNEAREELIQKGLERVKLFSWKKAAEQTRMIYES